MGIPARDLERVFERFYRVDRARSRGTGGTGLGLAIVRHVAGNHDGEVSVESQEGVGSTFRLRLPAAVGGARAGAAVPTGSWSRMSNQSATVLVVEDEESFVEALTVGLKREGFRVQVAKDGAQALDLFAAVSPDLVLLDVMLPKVSGIDVCRGDPQALEGADHHGDGQGLGDRHRRRASRSAPTTTSPSPTGCGSWWPACGPCSGGRRATRRRAAGRSTRWRSATSASIPSATRW